MSCPSVCHRFPRSTRFRWEVALALGVSLMASGCYGLDRSRDGQPDAAEPECPTVATPLPAPCNGFADPVGATVDTDRGPLTFDFATIRYDAGFLNATRLSATGRLAGKSIGLLVTFTGTPFGPAPGLYEADGPAIDSSVTLMLTPCGEEAIHSIEGSVEVLTHQAPSSHEAGAPMDFEAVIRFESPTLSFELPVQVTQACSVYVGP